MAAKQRHRAVRPVERTAPQQFRQQDGRLHVEAGVGVEPREFSEDGTVAISSSASRSVCTLWPASSSASAARSRGDR